MKPEPSVILEAAEPESIGFKYGGVYVRLTGFYAGLFRAMSWMYGEHESKERFWNLFHQKSGENWGVVAAEPEIGQVNL